MKKKFALCCILVMLVFTTITVNADVRGYRTTWDCIWFGTYPQTQVKDTSNYINKKYENNSWLNIYSAKTKDGEQVKIGRTIHTHEKYILNGKGNLDSMEFKYGPIKWRILKKEGNKVLLLSDKIIDQYYMFQPTFSDGLVLYIGPRIDFIWRNSTLRIYMNSAIYDMAFTEEEKEGILESKVTSNFAYKEGEDVTDDRLFILSDADLTNKYGFLTPDSLLCEMSDFSRASGTEKYEDYGKYGTYYTLSDGYKSTHMHYGDDSSNARCSAYTNVIDGAGVLKRENALKFNGIRAAMWVDLSQCKYQKAGTVSSDGEVNEIKFKYPIRLTKIQLKSVKNNKKRTISVKWKKIKDAKKYKIQFATNKKFKKAKVRICKKTSYQIKKLKKGKTYYVRVRAVNGKKQGKWSKVSKIKIRR